ncbi:hypothetical protein GOP47_0014847 [Adiantum capillus-veneris]|uniref:Fatty acid desaturase domain-containing protein n=1 Tax=Adiantum capillus-veneris TaxID=13818 RepID=A0A9D4UMB2_ADICA|nr:hypothetical protein GOP47_0014847 [Adiantum capillus-veneris]
MGAGGRMVAISEERASRAPHARPPFTVGQLKKAVPTHCFRRSLLTSSSYLVFDLLVAGALLYTTTFFTFPGLLGYASWCLYWIAQVTGGTTAIQGGFPKTRSFVPKTKDKIGFAWLLYSNPAGRLLSIVITLTLGWPLYLLFNVSGRPYERFASHFDPNGPIFNESERYQVLISDVSLVAVGLCIYKMAFAYGLFWLLKVYAIPVLIVNAFLVLITFLQHTHPSLPHYSDAEWEWLRGALSTVDRDYGILNHVFHHITDTHVAHHIFSTMPHYHAGEATKAIKPILGKYYQFDGTPIVEALWREFKECVFILILMNHKPQGKQSCCLNYGSSI